MVQIHHFHILHLIFDRAGSDGSALQLLSRHTNGILADTQQYRTYIACFIEVFPKFYDVPTGRKSKIVPFVEIVIDFERRGAFLPILIPPDIDWMVAGYP